MSILLILVPLLIIATVLGIASLIFVFLKLLFSAIYYFAIFSVLALFVAFSFTG